MLYSRQWLDALLRERQMHCWHFSFAVRKGQMLPTALHWCNLAGCCLTSRYLTHPQRTMTVQMLEGPRATGGDEGKPNSQHFSSSLWASGLIKDTSSSDYSRPPKDRYVCLFLVAMSAHQRRRAAISSVCASSKSLWKQTRTLPGELSVWTITVDR